MLSTNGSDSSTAYVSEEKRLTMRPTGVPSKKLILACQVPENPVELVNRTKKGPEKQEHPVTDLEDDVDEPLVEETGGAQSTVGEEEGAKERRDAIGRRQSAVHAHVEDHLVRPVRPQRQCHWLPVRSSRPVLIW